MTSEMSAEDRTVVRLQRTFAAPPAREMALDNLADALYLGVQPPVSPL